MSDRAWENLDNTHGTLCFHRQSLRGVVQDYIISFHEQECDIELMLAKTYDLFERLIEHYHDKQLKARLVAQVNYMRVDDSHQVLGYEDYHFASYSLEHVEDPQDFYQRHMTKIASRMDSFHQHGSRLLINTIKHIHIQLVVISPTQTS